MAPLKWFSIIAGSIGYCIIGCNSPGNVRGSVVAHEPVAVSPDFDGATVPPNIAPLNFTVKKTGVGYSVDLRAPHGAPLHIGSLRPTIKFPIGKWKNLLAENAGETLTVSISVRDAKAGWRTYRSRKVTIAREPIDPYLTFRQLKPAYNWWTTMAIYQRDLGGFRQRKIAAGEKIGCVNCHTFLNNRPDTFLLSTRDPRYGKATVLSAGGRVEKIDAAFGYQAWHPSGRFVTYTDMEPRQFFHTARLEVRDVIDVRERLMNFALDRRAVAPLPSFMGPRTLETFPAWTPAGKTLFFCSSPIPWDSSDQKIPSSFKRVQYSLCKVSYDPAAETWGAAETVVSAQQTGKSCVMPRVSPDGRFLLFCQCDYGGFPAFQKGSDLYLLNLASGARRRLDINSDESESWHCWSSNGRWIAFSSKRHDGIFTRIFFSYFDKEGNARKPFELPQEDPAWDASLLEAMSVPELTTGPLNVQSESLQAAAHAKGAPPAAGSAANDAAAWR